MALFLRDIVSSLTLILPDQGPASQLHLALITYLKTGITLDLVATWLLNILTKLCPE